MTILMICSLCKQPPTVKHPTTVKPVLSDHSKMEKTKILDTNGSLMKVKSIALLLTCSK